MPNMISERCELVKLCDINCSGPVFLRHCSLTTGFITMQDVPRLLIIKLFIYRENHRTLF